MYSCHFTATHSLWRHLTAIWPQFFTQIRPKLHKAAVRSFSRKLLQGGRWRALTNLIRKCFFSSTVERLQDLENFELRECWKTGGATSRLEGCVDISVRGQISNMTMIVTRARGHFEIDLRCDTDWFVDTAVQEAWEGIGASSASVFKFKFKFKWPI